MTSSAKLIKNADKNREIPDEAILKIAKEITVKFIEVGRITPASFATTFRSIYTAIDTTVRDK